MDSRIFIASAQKLIAKLESGEADQAQAQKEVGALFNGLLNPTLPTASKLRDAALKAGLHVDPMVQKRLRDAEVVWQF